MENNVETTTCIEKENTGNENKRKEASKTRRVGTVTVGLSMVAFGVMFLLCSVFGIMAYQTVFALWPAILIVLGMELLVFSFFQGKLVYDKCSVFIMILMLFLSAGMAAVDVCWKAAEYYMPYL